MKIRFVIFIVLALFISCSNASKNKKDAECFFKEKKYEHALVEINKAIKLEPDSFNHYIIRSEIYDLMGKYKEEVSDLSKIIELNKNTGSISLTAQHQRALVKNQLGLNNEALLDIDYFIENRDTVGILAEAYLNKASILYKLNDYKGSKKYYKLALKENIVKEKEKEMKAQAFVGLANLEKSPQKALKLLDQAILADDKSSLAYGSRSAVYFDLGKSKAAFDDSKKAISLNPTNATINATINFNMGQLFATYSDDLDSAIIYFENALKLSPQSPKNDMIYMNLALTKQSLGKLESALSDFQKGEDINPQNDLLLYNYSIILSDLGRNTEALNKITKAIDYNSKDPEYYNMKGSILLDLSKFDEAENEILKAVELNPNFGGAYYNLGWLNGKIGNYNKSISYYNKAVQLDFDLKATLVNMALQKLKINKTSSACSDLRKAYKLGRKDIKPLMDKYCN